MRSDSKRLRRAGLIVAIGALCTACAAGGYDAGAVRRHLVEAGLSPEAADCVVLRMGPRFGDDRLGARADPTAAEIAAERALMRSCGVKLAARSPRTPTPRASSLGAATFGPPSLSGLLATVRVSGSARN